MAGLLERMVVVGCTQQLASCSQKIAVASGIVASGIVAFGTVASGIAVA